MTPAEKHAMKARIFAAPVAELRPRGVQTPVPAASKRTPFAFGYHFLHVRVLAPAFVLVLVFGGVGTTAAAHGALPGDLLYPVKVSVNEAVEVALATTPQARAEVSTKLAERRVEEAEALAARGDLNPAVGEELAANFEEHADAAQESAEAVAVSDPAAAESLRTKLSSSLAAHGAILATLTEGGSSENQAGAGAVAAKVVARADGGAAPRSAKTAPTQESAAISMMVATDTRSTSSVQAATDTEATAAKPEGLSGPLGGAVESAIEPGNRQRVEHVGARAARALADTRERFEEHKSEFLETIVTTVSNELVEIKEMLDEARATLAAGDAVGAAELYTQAFERATKLEVLLRVEARLKRNIITPILEQKLIINQSAPDNPALL